MQDKSKNFNFSEKDLTGEQKEEFNQLKKTVQRFSGKSEAELLKELSSKVKEGKEKGTISSKKLESFAKKINPLLDDQQKKKLKKILKNLKDLD